MRFCDLGCLVIRLLVIPHQLLLEQSALILTVLGLSNGKVFEFGFVVFTLLVGYIMVRWDHQDSPCWAEGEDILQTRGSESCYYNLWWALSWSQ